MTLDDFKSKYPDLFNAVFAEGIKTGETAGFKKGKAEAQDQAKADGAKAERKRIQSVEVQFIPGHEKLIQDMKFDGETSGPEAAVQILQAEKALRQTVVDKLDKDAPDAVDAVVVPDVETLAAEDANLPIEDRAKAAWNKDPKLRKEFRSLEAYTAFCRAADTGKVKIFGNKIK